MQELTGRIVKVQLQAVYRKQRETKVGALRLRRGDALLQAASADAAQQGGGGWRILTAIVTTVRSAKAVITTFCRMLSCEDTEARKKHLASVKLEGNSESRQRLVSLLRLFGRFSAVSPGDVVVLEGVYRMEMDSFVEVV